MNRILKIVIVLCLTIATQTNAQEAKDELGTWYILASNNKITDQIDIQAQTQFRFYELASEIQQFKIRLGGTYQFSETFKAGLGYAYFNNDFSYLSETPENFNEQRLVVDAHLFQNLYKFKLQHRYRFEQRYLEDREDTSWLRYMLKANYKYSGKIAFDVYDEVFLNLNGDSFFAQNWIGAGVSYTFTTLIKARLGYQNIQTEGDDFNRILLGISFTPDFRKVENN